MNSIRIRRAEATDLAGIAILERTPLARNFVGQWSDERHRASFDSPDTRYYVGVTEAGHLAGFAILRGLEEDSGSVELKRLVVAAPGHGTGRKMLKHLMRVAFDELRAHRLFLDVMEDNARARHLYESLGFRYEGVLREAARRDSRYVDLQLMSMIESEFRGLES